MKIARYRTAAGLVRHGIVNENQVQELSGELFGKLEPAPVAPVPLGDVTLLAPLQPLAILAIGRNYKAHAAEFGNVFPSAPLLFIKSVSALAAPDMAVELPVIAPTKVDGEAELAVIIGRAARNVTPAEALDYVFGYTCANDLTARDCQRADGQWCRAKSFDTFAPLGPWIETELDPSACSIKGRLNELTLQESHTSLMIFDIPTVISYLSQGMTLLPGTVILTGTPGGIGSARTPPLYLQPGDRVEVEIEGIGTLRNYVIMGH